MHKILLPTPDAPPQRGGVARYIAATLRARADVALCILPVRAGTLRIISLVAQELRRVQEGHTSSPAQVWTHHVLPVGTACWMLSYVRPVAYTVFLHGMDFDLARRNVWKRFLVRRILWRASGVVANSRALCEEVSVFTGRKDVRVLYPCVSQELVDASEHTRKGLAHYAPEALMKMFAGVAVATLGVGVAQSQPVSSQAVRLLTVARLVSRKGHAKVLHALVRIPEATYTIAGSGPLYDDLVRLSEALGVQDRVTFLQDIADAQLPELYCAHDIFVMPTTTSLQDREGFGIVYAEAGLFGLPCIATRLPGVDEVLEDGVTGLLIEDTHEALVEALQRLSASAGLRNRMGSAARKRVLERFTEATWDVIVGFVKSQ